MPKRITYLERRDGLDNGSFREHWRTTHADIARDLPDLAAYRQNHVVATFSDPDSGAPYRVDGIVELWFANDGAAGAGFSSEVADRLVIDEQLFLGGLTGGPVSAAAPHRPWPFKVWLLARWADPGNEPGGRAWAWARALEASTPGVVGSAVNVLEPGARLLVREALRREEEIPEVAVVLGFDDVSAARAALTRSGDAVQDGERAGLGRIHAYLVEEIVIV